MVRASVVENNSSKKIGSKDSKASKILTLPQNSTSSSLTPDKVNL